jgi:exopolyphosphatase/guanosine-5'-triphosphate,3'-diphosphate pyrophosphatase
LILHAELLGIPPTEQVLVANVARYHRGSTPKKKHRNYGSLEQPLRQRIKRLGALLRFADGFDRGHVSAVKALRIRRLRRAVRVAPVAADARHPMRLEIWGAHRKSAPLAALLGVPIEIIAPDGVVRSSDELEETP